MQKLLIFFMMMLLGTPVFAQDEGSDTSQSGSEAVQFIPHYDPRSKPENGLVNADPGSRLFLETANSRVQEVSRQSYVVTYVIAGFGMLFLVIQAFMGRFSWKHAVALMGGLTILAGFQYMVAFLS